jgi:hypothetical protein
LLPLPLVKRICHYAVLGGDNPDCENAVTIHRNNKNSMIAFYELNFLSNCNFKVETLTTVETQ